MGTETNQYRPDYAVPPGAILEECLETHGISPAEFARRCGRSAKLISEIIAGKAPVEPETALQFEKVLGVDAGIWLGIETDYQLYRARESEAKKTKKTASWIKTFPLKELVNRKMLDKPASDTEVLQKLLTFFGVGSIDAWHTKYEQMNVTYRHSPRFQSDKTALATWLRLGELEAEQQECADYNGTQFKKTLKQIRRLTRSRIEEAVAEAQQLCNQAGVALVLVKPLPKTALSGAAWWLTRRKAVIELSLRHKTNDHLWFSLFHEAAHILLHSKKNIFLDWTKTSKETDGIESEANRWASNFLVPRGDWKQFVSTSLYGESFIRQFSEKQEITPGIVVGMLQHEGRLPWQTRLNKLKVRLEWKMTS